MRAAVLVLGLALAGCGATATRTVTVRAGAVAAPASCITLTATGTRLCGAEGRGYCEGVSATLGALQRTFRADPTKDPLYAHARAGCLRVGVDLAR